MGVSALSTPTLDRRSFERIFGLRRRRAIELMHHLGSYRSGKGYLLDRMSLLRLLEGLQNSAEFRWAWHQENGWGGSNKSAAVETNAAARSGDGERGLIRDDTLKGVRISAGRLIIEFSSPKDLLERLSKITESLAAGHLDTTLLQAQRNIASSRKEDCE